MLKDSILNTSISDKEDTRVGSVTPKYTMQRTVSTPKPPVSSPSFKSAMLQARSAQQERQTQTGTGAIRANLPSHNVDWKATTSAMAQKKNQYGAALDAMFPTQKHSAADIMMLDQLGIAERKGTINLRNTIPSANLNRVIQQYKNEHNGKAPQYNWEVQDWAEKRGIIANPKADNAEWSNLETAEHDLRLDEYESAEIEKRMTADALDRAAKAEGITPAANFALADIMPDEIRRESMYAGLNDTLEGLQTDNADALAFDRKYPELSHLDASNTSLYHADNISAHGNNGYAYKYVTQEAQDYLAAPTRLDTKTTAYLEQYNDLMADGVISVKQYNEFRVQLASMIDEAERRGITVEALVNTDPATKTYVEGIDENIAEFKRQKDANDKLMRDGSAETYEGIRSAIEQGEALSDEETAYYTQIVGTDISEAIKEDSGYKATVSALQDYGISKIEEYQAANPATIDGGYDYGVTNGYTYTAVSAQAMQYVDDIMKLAVSNGVDFDTMCASFGQNPTEVMQGAFDKALDDYVSLGQKVFEAYSAAFDGYKNMGLDTSFEQNVQSAVNAGDITSDQGKLLNDYYGTSTNNTMDRMALKQGDALEKGMFDAGFARSASQQAETETEAYKTGEVLKSEASGEGNLWYAVTRGAYGGAVMHLRSWGESIYFLMREDDATREADYRVMYSPSEVRQHHVEAISNIEDPTLRNMLMKQLDAFDGDIYNFKFDFRDAGVRDFIAKKDTTLRLLNAEGLDVLTPGQMDFMEAEMSAVNSGLYSLEELVLTRGVAGALGVNLATASKATRAAFAYPASMITMGLSEQAEVGNYILDQGGSKAEASAKGLLTNFVNSGLEVFGEGVEADIFGTAGILDDIDFTNSNWSQSLGLRVLKSTGKEGLATATQLGASISANILAKTAKEIPGEIIEELGQTAFSELMKTGNIDNVDAGEIVKNTILSTLIQGGVTNTVSGASTALSYRNGGEISSAIKTALVEEEGRYQENKMALETASANEMEGVVYTQEEIDEAVRKFSDNVSLTAKKNKFVAERVALGIEEQIVNTGLMAQEQTAKQTLDRATAAIPEAQAKADEAIRQFDEASAEFKYSEAADDADALRRFETAQQTAQLAQEGVTDAITAQVEAQRAYDAIKQKENDIVRMLHEQATLEAEAAYNPEAVQAAKEQIKQQELETLAQRHEARMREILNSTGALPEWFATKANALFSVIDDKVFRDYAQTRANVLSEVGDMVRNTFRGWGVVFERLNGHEGAVSFEGKNVYIDPEATPGTIINGLVAHEITHLAERSGNYNALVNAVKDAVYSGEDGEARFNADIAKIIADRKENGIEIGEATALHELVADLMARNILTGSSADTLAPVDTLATNWLLYVKNGNKAFGDTVMNWLDRRAKDMRKMGAEFGTNADYFARIVDQFRDTLADATANLENGTKPIASNTSTDSTETNVASNATAEPKSYNPLYESEAEALMRRARSNRANGEVSFYEDSKLNQQLRDDRVARGEPETIDDPADIVKALIDGRTDFTTTQELAPAWIDDEGFIQTTEDASDASMTILAEIESIEDPLKRADALDAYNYIVTGSVESIDTVIDNFMQEDVGTEAADENITEPETFDDDEMTAKTQEDVGVAEFSANTYSDASRNDKQRSADILFSADTFRDSSFARAVEDLLGFALKQAAETGDIQTYNRTIGKIYGITAKNKYRAGNTVTSPVNILRLLATETSGNLYEGGGVGKTTVVNPETKDKTIIRHLADYDAKSRAIVSDRIDASNFAAVMLDVAKNIEAKIPDFHSGVLKADGTELGLQDFFFDYMTTRDSVIAANPALSSLKQEIDAFKAEMQKNKETSTMLDAIEHRRDQLCKLTDTALVAQTYKVRVESMLRSKADARSEKEKKNGVLRKIYADMVDRTVYASWLDNISNKINGTSGKNYTKTMQIGETSEAYLRRRAQTWIDGACADMGGNATGHQSATDIMHKHKVKRNQYSVLNDYLMAKEALDRYELYEGELAEIASKGEKREPTHKPPFGIDEDNEVFGFTNLSLAPTKQDLIDFIADVEANNKNVADACADLYEWWDGFMRTIAVNEGLLTEEEYDRMHREHPHYAPLKRKDDSYSFMRAVGGSTEQVINPFEQMLAMQTQFVNNAARNRTYRAFDTVYNNTPGLGIIASKIDASDIATGARTLPTSGNTITVHRADGTTAYYIVKDKNLLDMMNDSGNEIQLRGFFKVAGAVTRNMAKLTTGVNMLFAVKNMTRDFQHAVTYGSFASNYFTGLLKWLSANVDVWRYALTGKSTQQMEDFANMGGYGYERYDVGQKKSFGKLKRGIFVNNTNVGKVVSKTLSGFVNFIEAQTLNEVIETTSRYAEYKYGKVDTGATASAQQKLEAFMNSREATVDFERHGSGAAAKLIRQFVPFINASTQGVAQSIRAVVDPAERSRLAPRVAKVAFNYAITGALSALLMLKFNGGETDEEKERIAQAYIDEADDLKRQFILIPGLGLDGARDCWRLPVGQDMWGRMFYEFGRKGAEMYFTKADGYEDLVSNGFLADVLDVLVDASFGTFTEATTIFSPINEVLKNQNYYNEPIVSDKLQKQYYTNQYTDSTSDVYIVAARMANGILNMFGVDDRSDLRNVLSSPVALQYWTSQYTGLLGQIIPAMLSKDKFTGEVTPVKGLKKLVKNSFTLDLDTGSDIEAAVDELQQYTQEISAAADAQKDYIGLMDIRLTKDEMTEGVAQAKAWNATGGLFSELNKEKGALWSVYYDIMGDPNLSDAEKENRVEREVYAPIAELNKQALRELAPFEAKYRSSTWSEIKAAVSATDATMPNPARSQVAAANFNGGFADDWSNGAAYMTEFADVYDQSTGSTTMPYTAGLKSFDILGVNYEPSASDITAMEDEYYKYYSDAANKLVASKEWQNATLEEKQKKAKKVHSDAYAAAKKWYTDTYHIKTKK